MVASQFIRVDMEVKEALSVFKVVERESFNEVLKRILSMIFDQDAEVLTEAEKKAILNAIKSVEKGKVQSFEQMMKNIHEKRMTSAYMGKRGLTKESPGRKDPGYTKDVIRD